MSKDELCCNCRFWIAGKVTETEDAVGIRRDYIPSVCCRYPEHMRVGEAHFCGEFKSKSDLIGGSG
jgi:hypothetical protein